MASPSLLSAFSTLLLLSTNHITSTHARAHPNPADIGNVISRPANFVPISITPAVDSASASSASDAAAFAAYTATALADLNTDTPTDTNTAAGAATVTPPPSTLSGTALYAQALSDAAANGLTGSAASLYASQEVSAIGTDGGNNYGIGGDPAATLTGSALSAAYSDQSAYLAAQQTGFVGDDMGFNSTNTTDACGTTPPDPSVYDSCSTPVEQSENNMPAAYGVQCLNDTKTADPVNITSCATLIPELCSNQWQRSDEWVWLTNAGCSLGSYLPNASTIQGAAQWPSEDQCTQLIFAAMVDDCQYSGVGWNLAAVNLKVLPSDDPVGNSGQAVNPGYGSYIVSTLQQRSLSDAKNCGGGTATGGQGACAALSSPAASWTPGAAAASPAAAAPAGT